MLNRIVNSSISFAIPKSNFGKITTSNCLKKKLKLSNTEIINLKLVDENYDNVINQVNRSLKFSLTSLPSLTNTNIYSLKNTQIPKLNFFQDRRCYATTSDGKGSIKTFVVPGMGDSIVEGRILEWKKQVGDQVKVDNVIVVLETDKTSVDIPAKDAGVIIDTFNLQKGDTVRVGQELYKLQIGGVASNDAISQKITKPSQPQAQQPQIPQQPPQPPQPQPSQQSSRPSTPIPTPIITTTTTTTPTTGRGERRERMSLMRLRIAERLKQSQNTAAMLTTFQECDMSALMAMREKYKEEFDKKHGSGSGGVPVKLGYMSAFVTASSYALKDFPQVNAVIDGQDIIWRDYHDISVAVATPTGLAVPVLRNVQSMSFSDIEKQLAELGKRARDMKLKPEEMVGGTFTISNGGVYGSLMGTPIINPPQSAILGMHAINKRPVVITDDKGNDTIAIRPMMYLALTYDHRLIDGREAVSFLRRIKALIEDPTRFVLNV